MNTEEAAYVIVYHIRSNMGIVTVRRHNDPIAYNINRSDLEYIDTDYDGVTSRYWCDITLLNEETRERH